MNVADPFEEHAAGMPGAAAVIDGGRVTDYGALDTAARRAAARFLAEGWPPGSVIGVSILGPVDLQLAVMLALARIGAVQLPLPALEPPRAHDEATSRFRVRAVVADHRSIRPGISLIAPDPAWLHPGGSAPGLAPPTAGGNDPWTIVQSSGTTGPPKAVLLSHAMELARSDLQPAIVRPAAGERVLSLIPVDYRSGRSAALRCLSLGATFVAAPHGAPATAIIDLIEKAGVTVLIATPSQLAGIVPLLPHGPPRFPQIRVLRTNAGMMPPALLDQVRARLTPNLHVDYGTNDIGTIAIATPDDLARHPGTTGRPLDGIALEIVGDDDRPVPAGTPGQIRVRGPGLARGYLGDDAASALAFRAGWFHPGDIGALNEEGLLFVHGRMDSLINFGGVKVSPQEIEAAALAHPAVAEAVAFGVPSSRYESVPAVAVLLHPGADGSTLRRHMRDRLGSRAPRHLVEVPEMPRDVLGKVSRQQLIDLVQTHRAKGGKVD